MSLKNTDNSGYSVTNISFFYNENTQVDGSCGFILQNELWIAGGWGNNGANKRQGNVYS